MRFGRAGALLAVVVTVASCSSHPAATPSATTASTGSTTAPALQCEPAGQTLESVLTAGLRATVKGPPRHLAVVRSKGAPAAFFIVAEVSVSGRTERALWVSTSAGGSGPVFSMNTAARKVSTWNPAAGAIRHYSPTDPAALAAMACP